MKHLCLLVLLALGAHLYGQQEIGYTLNYQDSTREFLVHLPPQYTPGSHLPVVFNFHGSGSDGPQEIFYTRMDITANNNGFICVFPNGLSHVWNSGFDGTGPYNSGVDDVGFVSKMIDTLSQLYDIDLTRVYACGMSNGGYQSYRLACELENRIAAIASVAGTLTDSTAFYCALSRRLPILEVHGTNDPLVPYGGSPGSYGIEDLINYWINKDQCTAADDTIFVTDTNPNDSSTVQKIKYYGCSQGTKVWLYKIIGGGHSWPSASIDYIYGPTNRDINASQEIWDFFKQYTLNGPVAINEPALNSIAISVFPNPVGDEFSYEVSGIATTNIGSINLFDVNGKVVAVSNSISQHGTIHTKALAPGLYFLRISGDGFTATKRIMKQ